MEHKTGKSLLHIFYCYRMPDITHKKWKYRLFFEERIG